MPLSLTCAVLCPAGLGLTAGSMSHSDLYWEDEDAVPERRAHSSPSQHVQDCLQIYSLFYNVTSQPVDAAVLAVKRDPSLG